MKKRKSLLLSAVMILSIGLISAAGALGINRVGEPAQVCFPDKAGGETAPIASGRLIVMLKSPPLVDYGPVRNQMKVAPGRRLNVRSSEAINYVSKLRVDQDSVMNSIGKVLLTASISKYIDQNGMAVENRYTHLFNGMAIDIGPADIKRAMNTLRKVPGVQRVFKDTQHFPTLYASLPLINTDAAWDNPAIGGIGAAGEGIKVASMDGGVHHDAPMFNGDSYDYPVDYPKGGLGDTENNNGKIIVSRAYFRANDPPAAGDENVWPGLNGISHGVHTASTMAGNPCLAYYMGEENIDIKGVAPRAWVMSYRVFYASQSGQGGFFDAEGIAALEDIVADGADVLNNSWGVGPVSPGGEGDPLDMALLNAAKAGIFVSMSTGNSGPGNGTVDHPSDEYISVAASTTSGTYAAGRLNALEAGGEEPPEALLNIAYGTSSFGEVLPSGEIRQYELITAQSVDSSNTEGCNPWTETPFAGKAVLIRRGSCFFSDKVYYAQQGGAVLVIIYNNQGDDLMNMSCGGEFCDEGEITIPSVFIGQSTGEDLEAWFDAHNDAYIELDTVTFQAGNQPDYIIDFSSRGPAVGNVLKPDIAAPGVNIMAQGYTPGTTGEARHLGFGQVSGTSMASPHVAGAATLLRQIHPDWSNAYIKSALMSTSKYLNILNQDNTPAQPLDMGAGRLDLTNAADPGVILDPPSLSYGLMEFGENKSITVIVTNITDREEIYTVSTLFTGDGFDSLKPLDGFSVSPSPLTIGPGESADLTVIFASSLGVGIGDNQGYIILEGNHGHHAHMPAWARVKAPSQSDILIIDNDFSDILGPLSGFPDYLSYYTDSLDILGVSYDVRNADLYVANPTSIPDAAHLLSYKAIIYFSGNNNNPDGSFTVSTPLTELDMNRLTGYVNSGGKLIAMGQDIAAAVGYSSISDTPLFYSYILGGKMLQDSITPAEPGGDPRLPELPVLSMEDAPSAFSDILLDLSGNESGDGARNQAYIDELDSGPYVDSSYESEALKPYTPIFQYNGPDNIEEGIVTILHRDNPALERPGLMFSGRTVYASFGLEGVNNLDDSTSRAVLLKTFLDWINDEPAGSIQDISEANDDNALTFQATLTSNIEGTEGVSYRWDFGDGSDFTEPSESSSITHAYAETGEYAVRCEITDSWGNRVIATLYTTGELPEAGPGEGGEAGLAHGFE